MDKLKCFICQQYQKVSLLKASFYCMFFLWYVLFSWISGELKNYISLWPKQVLTLIAAKPIILKSNAVIPATFIHNHGSENSKYMKFHLKVLNAISIVDTLKTLKPSGYLPAQD